MMGNLRFGDWFGWGLKSEDALSLVGWRLTFGLEDSQPPGKNTFIDALSLIGAYPACLN